MPKPHAQPEPTLNLHAVVAGWLLPGLGHLLLGLRLRGVILMVSITGLWLGGLLIGGVSVVDFQKHRFWFVGQMLIAPSLGVEMAHRKLAAAGTPHPDDPARLYEPSFGHTNEQGLLFTSLAGLLNLLAMFDVLYCDPAHRRRRERLLAEARPAAGDGDDAGGTEQPASP
jgi:hypothetical protein